MADFAAVRDALEAATLLPYSRLNPANMVPANLVRCGRETGAETAAPLWMPSMTMTMQNVYMPMRISPDDMAR